MWSAFFIVAQRTNSVPSLFGFRHEMKIVQTHGFFHAFKIPEETIQAEFQVKGVNAIWF